MAEWIDEVKKVADAYRQLDLKLTEHKAKVDALANVIERLLDEVVEVKTALKATGSVPRPASLASQVTPLAEVAEPGAQVQQIEQAVSKSIVRLTAKINKKLVEMEQRIDDLDQRVPAGGAKPPSGGGEGSGPAGRRDPDGGFVEIGP